MSNEWKLADTHLPPVGERIYVRMEEAGEQAPAMMLGDRSFVDERDHPLPTRPKHWRESPLVLSDDALLARYRSLEVDSPDLEETLAEIDRRNLDL